MQFTQLINKPVPYILYQWMWSALDWVYPPACGGCGKSYDRWCLDCQAAAFPEGSRVTSSHREMISPLNALQSCGTFSGPLREAIHKLKYQRDLGLGEALSRHVISRLLDLDWQIDLIVPVPLSEDRQEQRGYNQSALLALPVALALKLPFRPNSITRTRNTLSQVGLSASERQANVAGAFQADQKTVKMKSVLLIDDVRTTGATMDACARALSDAGATSIYAIAIASAVFINEAEKSSMPSLAASEKSTCSGG